ncbi:hypothetical protein SAMN04515656_104145 [Eubacterium aggregans]|uniref:Phage major tail protein, TP901-1 family n=1 Tax=Eubacterium aggregans TaxID=81409 RepID=A0A1H3YXX2_9FIRM|nr:hypothetical protein [Eubacterium aggregans]SEA15914.1 hypothetical protein SAMN04515656_104145 [Eubacterium aggregans]
MTLAKHGVTATTPKSILFGAGVVYKNLKCTEDVWSGTVLGATSGGSKLSIKNELSSPEIDGVTVKLKGLDSIKSQEVTLEVNLIELNKDTMKLAILGMDGTSDAAGFDLIEMKGTVETGDYLENIAIVGYKTDNTPITVILENAICTSGMEIATKNNEASVSTLTFEPRADASEAIDKLPVKIYASNASYSTGV